MKYTDIEAKDINELNTLLKEKKTELFEQRIKLKTMQLSNPNEIKATRRDVARIKTALNAKKGAK